MPLISQVLFVLLACLASWLFANRIRSIRRNILLGQNCEITGTSYERWKNLALLAFGQKKMFRNPLVAFLHLVIYLGFIIINLEVLEILLDGVSGSHRLFLGALGRAYPILINAFEFLAAGVILVCVIFLARRNIIKLKRFISHDLDGWPRSDANYILLTEIVLMCLFLSMNATDVVLQGRGVNPYASQATGSFLVSSHLMPFFSSFKNTDLEKIERACWWLHITGILAFLNYLPFSKHLHILLAFPNAYYSRLEPLGQMKNMPTVQKEVLYAMEPDKIPPGATSPEKFGAKDVMDLSWKNLLDAYSCTECGRCSDACPANITGKLLSPRKIMMSTRDRLEEVGRQIKNGGKWKEDGKTLLHNYITVEELRACTTCNACVQECPVSINPLEIILELRRSLVMEESNAPQEWNSMFSNVENNFAPWKFSPDDRDHWVNQ
jgi:heterodisulfide reductase subunit C